MVYYSSMIERQIDIKLIRTALRRSRIVALLGPRQCGKTTLARQFVAPDSVNYFKFLAILMFLRILSHELMIVVVEIPKSAAVLNISVL